MSLFSTLQTGASGLGASGRSLGVIGDNIANLNTVGYKRNRASFADMLPEGVSGLGGPSQMGRGVTTVGIGSQFTQGTLESTGNPLDMALAGGGFFQVANADGNHLYTRDGSFGLDEQGYVVTGTGLRVQGYNGTPDGTISPVIGDLRLADNPVPPNATSQIALDIVLDPATSNGVDYSAFTLDGTTSTIDEASEAADFTTSITVYDSLGRAHDVVVNFEQNPADPSEWDYSVVIDGSETDVAGAIEGGALEIGSGTLSFNTDGELVGNTYAAVGGWTWPGSSAFDPEIALGLTPGGAPSEGSIINSGAGTGNTLSSISQDGYSVGNLVSVAVDPEGVVVGRYSNGEEIPLGQVAVALFDAEAGLERLGGNLYQETRASGDPALGRAGAGGRGDVVGFALERSNVDLEDEFVDMIRAQRSFQANAGVIRTADETLQELVNLV